MKKTIGRSSAGETCCSVAQSCPTLCDPMDCSTSGFPVLHHLLEFAQTHVHWVSDAIQPSHPLSSPSLALNLSQHQGLSNELALCIRWPKDWSFSISPSSEYSEFPLGLTPLVWSHCCSGDSQDLLQNHNSKASILWCSAFFIVQLSYLYETTGETTALTIWTFVCSVMSGF